MKYTSLVSEDIVSSLDNYRQRLKEKIEFLQSKQDDVAEFIQLLDDDEDGIDLEKSVVDIVNNIVPTTGVSMLDQDGLAISFHSVNGPGVIWVFRDEWYDGVQMNKLLLTIFYDVDNPSKVLKTEIDNTIAEFQSKSQVVSLFCLNFGEGLSELLFQSDIIKETIAGHLNSAADFVAIFGDKIGNPSTLFLDYYNQMKDVVTASATGGPTAILSAIAGKLNYTSKLTANSHTNVIEQPDESTWKMSTLNWGAIWDGILSAAQILGEALAWIGQGWVTVIGVVANTAATIISRVNDTLVTQALPSIDENAFLNSWYGNVGPGAVDRQDISFLGDLEYPVKFFNGFTQCILTVDAEEVVYARFYDYALLKPQALQSLVSYCEEYLGYRVGGDSIVTQQVPSTTTTSKLDALQALLVDATISQGSFDALSDNDKAKSMMASTLLLALGMEGEVEYTGAKFYWCNVMGLTVPGITLMLNSGASLTVHDQQYTGVGSNITAIIYGWASLAYSTLSSTDFEMLVNVRNMLFTRLSNENKYNTGFLLARGNMLLKHNYVVELNGTTMKLSDMSVGSGFRTADYIRNKQEYLSNLVSIGGIDSLIRYYPPAISNPLKVFIQALAISVAVCGIVGAAIYGFKKITNGRKQAKLYANYDKANDAYKANPTVENFKALKKSTRKLNRNVRLYGSSKYLSTLSGARFGWGESTEGDLLSSLMNPMDNNIETSDTAVLYKVISGQDLDIH